MRLAASLPVRPRWFPTAVLLAVFGALPAVRAQAPAGTYGVELRGAGDGSRVEARVGPDTAHAESRRTALVVPKSPQPFTVKWSGREVSVTIAGQSVRYAAAWRIGNVVRISARGNVRASIGVVGGRRVDKTVSDDLAVAGAYLEKGWTLEGAIDWPDEPTPADELTITSVTQDPSTFGTDPKDRKTFTGGVADSSVFAGEVPQTLHAPPSSRSGRLGVAQPIAGASRTWTGASSRLWSDADNWSPAGVPGGGDVLTFGPGPTKTTLTNDLSPAPVLGGIVVRSGTYEIQENAIALALNSQSQIERDFGVDGLSGGGTIAILNETTLTVGRQGQAHATSTTFSGTITGANAILTKDGPGSLTFSGDASRIKETRVTEGFFFLDGGSLSTVLATGPNQTLAMANNAHVGFLNVRNNGELGSVGAGVATTGDIQMEEMDYLQTIGPNGFQQLVATGTVNLSFNGKSRLDVQLAPGYQPPLGSTIIMVENDGTDPVQGTFDRLPEGSTIDLGGVVFRLSYVAGTGNDIGLTVVQSGSRPDLAIAKSKSGSFIPGATGAFTLRVSNVGTAATTRTVSVTDTLPAGFAPQTASGTGWGCTITGQQVACSRADALAPSLAFPDITIDVLVAASAQDSTNTATVRVDGDQNTGNDSATIQVPIGHPIDLAINKKSDLAAFQQGGTGTYRIDVNNAGTAPSSGTVTVTDSIPAGLTPTTASGTGWTCSISGQTVTCTRATAIGVGNSTDPILIKVSIASTAPSSVTNTATLTGGGDTVPGNNTATDVTIIAAVKPDLSIAKEQGALFVRGQPGQFMITVRNGGAGPTSGQVTVTDTLAAGLTPTTPTGAGWTCNIAGQSVTCTRSDALAPTSSYPAITLPVSVAPNATATMNTANVTGGGDDTPGNNTVTIPVNISVGPAADPDLTIAKTHTGSLAQGGIVTFEIVVRAALGGPATSGTVTVTDPFPASLTPASALGPGWSCSLGQTVTCVRSDSLSPGTEYPISIVANVSLTATSGANTVTVSGGGDTSTTNNTATDPFTVTVRSPDLTITKTHSGQLVPGTNATFTINVSNVGPVPSVGTVTVQDVLPNGLSPASANGTGWNCQTSGQQVTCTRSDGLSPSSSYPEITLVAAVAAGAASGENVAVVSGGGDATPDNNRAIDAFVVSGSPNLTLAKTHAGNFTVGQQGAQYQIVVRNAGTAPTVGEVVVQDPVPLGLTPVSASGGSGWTCTIAGQAVDCRRSSDTLGAGLSWPAIAIAVNVGSVAGTLNNIATVSGGGDGHPEDNSVVDPTTIVGAPQLTILKVHANPVLQGQQDLPFSVTVTNNGSGPTTGTVTVTDPLPAGLTPTSASGPDWTCTIAGATVTCTRADALPASADYPAIQIRANVAANATTVTNAATVAGGGDTTPADNTFNDLVPISPAGQPNLIVTKRHTGDFFQGQQDATYQIRVANFGVAPTTGTVTVADDLPVGLTPTSASGAGWACAITGLHVQCTRSDSIGPGAVYPEIAVVCQVANNATDIVNVATATGGGDTTPGDSSGSDTTHIVPRSPNLVVTKRHVDPFLVGQPDANYQITVQNVGSAPTIGEVVVADGVPSGLVPAAVSGAGWACTISGQSVTCRRSDSLAAGGSHPVITLRVNVLAGASNVANVVSVSGGGDTTAGNNTAVDATSINVTPDAIITLAATSPLVVADVAEFQSVVGNLGPGWLGGQTFVAVSFPTELIPIAGTGDGWDCRVAGQQVLCERVGSLGPSDRFSPLRFRVGVRLGPAVVTVSALVSNNSDSNAANNVATTSTQTVLPATGLTIQNKTTTPSVAIGGTAAYQVDVVNTGQSRLEHIAVEDLLPRGFAFVPAAAAATSSQRTALSHAATVANGVVTWTLGTLNAGEAVTLTYRAIVGADARSGLQDDRATVSGTDTIGAAIQAGPAVATVEVTTSVFTMLQAIVGRVFEDVDGNGLFGGGDRPIANARVITSTGQAALTDAAGMYNIPSIGSGTVAVSLDRDTIPSGLTVIDGPGGRSWTRMLRTPIGGGTLLTQNFPLRRAAAAATSPGVPTTPPDAADINRVPDDPAAGNIPPRRDYESRQGSSLFIGLGEVSFGRAAQEFELFQKDHDVWATGSVFYQGPLVSAKNRLTFAVDSRRHLNGTTDQDRLFELDPNDRMYPVFGDSSRRQEFATANSKVFARVERGTSHVMWGDLIGDLPSSATDGGRWSSYQRHLTGFEVRVADKAGDHVTVRGAQPKTAYARDVFAGGTLGLMTLSHTEVLAGTETIALEVRDRRMPDRLLERDVLARGVDYQLEPGSGTVFLQRNVSGIEPQLNLVQIVATYEYENQGLDHMVFNGRAAATYKSVRGGVTFFTEEGLNDTRFTVFGFDFAQSLPRGGRWRLDLPFSHGTPNVASSVDSRPVSAGADTDGFAIQGEVEQPIEFWSGVLHASFLHADDNFRNPFSATITPGAGYFNANAALSPRKPSRVTFGVTYERYNTTLVDASRTTLSAEWAETIGKNLTLKAGYDGRSLDQSGADLDSGLFTGQAIVKVGDRFEGRVAREQNVRDDTDPTYPDQTLLGARWKMTKDTSLFYTQRISDSAIVPIGDFATTGFSQLNTKGELNVGVESRVQDTTQLTSGYRVEQGVNGPDAYAMIGVLTHVKLRRGLGTSFGLEHGQLVSGPDDSYTSGSLAVDWLPSDRFKATTRYEARDRGGYESLFTAGAAARLYSGFTGLTRLEWTSSDHTSIGDAKAFLAAVALRPMTSDRVGWLLSYQFVDGGVSLPTVAPGRANPAWQHLLSTDGYVQPIQWLELHGKFAWQRTDPALGLVTDTYLSQFRAQAMFSTRFDGAIEQRYIWQPASDSHRNGTALEFGFWPIADARIALGYNFHDSRDPYGRDLQGRDKGVYLTLSTKLSYLFDLFGSKPPAAQK